MQKESEALSWRNATDENSHSNKSKKVAEKTGNVDSMTLTKDQLKSLLQALSRSDVESLIQHVNGESALDEKRQKHVGKVVHYEKENEEDVKKNSNYSKSPSLLRRNKMKQCQEIFEEWNPWGKPGGGAPLKRQCASTGDLVHYRGQSPSWSHTDGNGCRFGTPITCTYNHPSTDNDSKYIPMALASSIPFGNNEDVLKLKVYKEEQKKRWLEELNKQREEQRVKKEKEKLSKTSSQSISSLTDPTNYSSTLSPNIKMAAASSSPTSSECYNCPSEQTSSSSNLSSSPRPMRFSPPVPSSNETSNMNNSSSSSNEHYLMDDLRMYPKQHDGFGNDAAKFEQDGKNNQVYLRGHNVPKDPAVLAEREDKRKTALKYQRDIQRQIEQKEKLKYMEKLRKEAEEVEAEERFKKQQVELQRQFEMEQENAKKKALADEEKRLKIFGEMQKAKMEAEADKKARRKNRAPMESGVITPDVCRLPKAVNECGAQPIEAVKVDEGLSKCNGLPISTQTEQRYLTDRMLTPSIYRTSTSEDSTPGSSSRDFGTQTDDLELRTRKNKNQKYSGYGNCSSAQSDVDRPKWGVNKPQTAYLKQSEKDLNSERRRKENPRGKRRIRSKAPPDSDSTITSFSAESRRKWSDQEEYDLGSTFRQANRLPSPNVVENLHSQTPPNVLLNYHSENGIAADTRLLTTDRETPNQDRILQQLSVLRQGLLRRQLELQRQINTNNDLS